MVSSAKYQSIVLATGLSLLVVALVCIALPRASHVELEFDADAQKALSLEISKKKYDAAKANVKTLSEEFNKLKSQLQEQVSTLQNARTNLVSQIASVQGAPVVPQPTQNQFVMRANGPDSDEATTDNEEGISSPENDRVSHLRYSAASIASAGSADDAATASEHALHYTEQVASRVGDLADQSEEQAERIVDAARLTQEAKEAMQTALEQSSRIVDYNTHAAQAVAQDSGFVSTGAQTIAGYLKDIFHDARAVHAAATYSVAHMNKDVEAADHAVEEIESDAEEAAEVLGHIHAADAAAVAFAKHARASAVTASDAADGALQGQRAAVAGGVRAVAAAHAAEGASHAAAEYAAAARGAPRPRYHYGAPHPRYYNGAPHPRYYYGPGGISAADALVQAKALVEAVVVLMQQLTNALEAAGSDCGKVDQILAYYQVQMARYHSKGQAVAGALSDEDLELVQRYAEVQVEPFAAELQEAVEGASKDCGIPVEAFIPDTGFGGGEDDDEDDDEDSGLSAAAAAGRKEPAILAGPAAAPAAAAAAAAAKRAHVVALKARVKAQAAAKRVRRRPAAAKAPKAPAAAKAA